MHTLTSLGALHARDGSGYRHLLAVAPIGRSADAARCYTDLLARQSDHPDALHLFGVLHHQNGYSARAVELISQAVALRPEVAAYHANLAEAHRALGQHQQAIDCCQAALRLRPDHAEAANNLGLALQALGRREEAVEKFCAALVMRPGFAMAQNNRGDALREQGHIDEAIEAFRAAVALDPKLGMAHANLGQMLIDRGLVEEALPCCEEAVRKPRVGGRAQQSGKRLSRFGRWPEAACAYAQAVIRDPKLARAHANLGLALMNLDRPDDAAAALARAIELTGEDDVEMWQALANAHAANYDFAAAIPCCERVVALRPTLPLAHNDLGWSLQQEGRFAAAAECYATALQLQPDNIVVLVSRGGLHEELGRLDEAEADFFRARELNPRAPAPLSQLATLLKGKLPEPLVAAIRQQLDDPLLADGPRRGLLFGLAHALDGQGEHAEAAQCLATANALSLTLRHKQGKSYDPQEHSRHVDRLIESFTPEVFARLAGAGSESRQPVFVFGVPRSGTTLVEQVLASHRRVYGAGELRLARESFEALPWVTSRDDNLITRLAALDAAAVGQLSQRHLADLAAIVERGRPGDKPERVVDKMPDNYLYLGLSGALVSQGHAGLCPPRSSRHRGVVLDDQLPRIRWASDFEHIAARFADHRRIMAHWQAVLPVPIYEVEYERLVDDFETEARRLVAACGLEWEPACLDFHQTTRPVRTASVTQVRQPLYRKSLARWKHYEAALTPLFARLQGDPGSSP